MFLEALLHQSGSLMQFFELFLDSNTETLRLSKLESPLLANLLVPSANDLVAIERSLPGNGRVRLGK